MLLGAKFLRDLTAVISANADFKFLKMLGFLFWAGEASKSLYKSLYLNNIFILLFVITPNFTPKLTKYLCFLRVKVPLIFWEFGSLNSGRSPKYEKLGRLEIKPSY
ncbi:MAG: hypothetical protein ACJA1I_001078 [Zhongshania marina]